MFFVNGSTHIVKSNLHTEIDFFGRSIKTYKSEEELLNAHLGIKEKDIIDIPFLTVVEEGTCSQYFMHSRLINREEIVLYMGETIEDWIETQEVTFTEEDGYII